MGGTTVDAPAAELTWTEVPDATEYRVQMAPETDFESLLLDTSVAPGEPSLLVQADAPMDGSTCYWRVRAQTPDGPTEWSPVGHFTGPARHPPDAAPPDAPQPVQPVDGDPVDGRAAVFAWEPSPNAVLYELQVAPRPDFATPVAGLSVEPVTSLTLYSALPEDGSTFYWRVRAQGPADSFTPWSEPSALTATTDEAVRRHEPASGPHEEDLAHAHRIKAAMPSVPKNASEPVKTARTSRKETVIWAVVTLLSFVITILLVVWALP